MKSNKSNSLMATRRLHAEKENIFFFSSLMDETIHQLTEARDYFTQQGSQTRSAMSPEYRLLYSNEMSRITMRLSCVMAWILAQKAVANGEMSRSEALQKYRLYGQSICMTKTQGTDRFLPPYMDAMLEKSYVLYTRVMRLDEQMINAEAEPA